MCINMRTNDLKQSDKCFILNNTIQYYTIDLDLFIF